MWYKGVICDGWDKWELKKQVLGVLMHLIFLLGKSEKQEEILLHDLKKLAKL